MNTPTIVKLGGSAITDKSRKCTPNIPVIQHATDQLARYDRPLVLIHGGGSYAHPFVTGSGLDRGLRSRSQNRSVSETEFYLGQLTRIISGALLLRNKYVVPIHPLSFVTLNERKVPTLFLGPVVSSLKAGLWPLMHGDLVFDQSRGMSVLSGDRIASMLGPRLNASRVLLGCDVDGVYSASPKTSRSAELISQVTPKNYHKVLEASRGLSSDATGGMGEKVRQALKLAQSGCECDIFNLKTRDTLGKLLKGEESVGTRFLAWKKPRKFLRQRLRRA